MDKYQAFLEKKLSRTFKGMDIFVFTIDNKYDDDNKLIFNKSFWDSRGLEIPVLRKSEEKTSLDFHLYPFLPR